MTQHETLLTVDNLRKYFPVRGGLLQTVQAQSGSASAVGQASSGSMSEADQRALLNQYCVTCHNVRLKTGGVVLESLDPTDVSTNAALLEKVARKAGSDRMPPAGQPRPDRATMLAFTSTLERALDRSAEARPNPGWLPIRRLNRFEYANAIRDMFSLEIDANALLPSDDSAFGFDNNAESLAFSPALMARARAPMPLSPA